MQIPKLNFLVLFLLSACFITVATAQKNNLTRNDFKQLAGPSEDISEMRLPNPADLGSKSKAATLPVAANRSRQKFEIPIENAADFRLMLLAPDGEKWDIKVALPNEDFINLRQNAAAKNIEITKGFFDGLGNAQVPSEVYTFKGTAAGILRVEINTNRARSGGFLVAWSKSPLRLYSYINTLETVRGGSIGLVASLLDSETEKNFPGNISEASARIEAPNGKIIKTPMFDDGNHNDGLAGDGVFGTAFIPNQAGNFIAKITAKGTTANGEAFLRTAEHLFDVAAKRVSFDGNALVKDLDGTRFQIDLSARNLRAGQKVIAHAEVWGRDANGDFKAIAWIGGMTLAEKSVGVNKTVLPLTLDARWLARSDAIADFQLRNIRVQDVDSFVVLGVKELVALPPIDVPENLRSNFDGEITDEMRNGVASPVKGLQQEPQATAVKGPVMLVHGYCSSDVWGPAAARGEFVNYVIFRDLRQNRTHDQFALRIRDFGANLPAFAIVSHSQGGAAGLHLAAFYRSRLDYGGGFRRLQSVGAPYLGTPLAGYPAKFAEVLGKQCGSNNSLTTWGAASWMNNIPPEKRKLVFYYTTSYTETFGNDWCSFYAQGYLEAPEDGVIEKSKGQLSGAYNIGHKEGWCHTSDMRDPPQTQDSDRNRAMNYLAARWYTP